MLRKALVYSYFALPIILTVVFMVWQLVRIRRKTRWPISDKLLRPPGESCRLKLEQFDERWIFHFLGVLLVWFVCVLILIKIQQAVAPQSLWLLLTMAAIGVFIASAGAWWLKRYMDRRADYALGFYGERTVGEQLNQLLREGCHVFHDFPKDRGDNIDHIIVAPSGLYVVETKARRKHRTQKGRADYKIQFDGDTLTFPHCKDRYGLDQARDNAKWLSGYLSSATGIDKLWVEPILTFPGWMINCSAKNPSVQVLNPKKIGEFVLGLPVRLTAQSIKQIVHVLDQKCRDVDA